MCAHAHAHTQKTNKHRGAVSFGMLSTPGIKYNTERQKHPSSSGCTTVMGNCANSNDVEEAFDMILFSEIQRSNFILSAFFPYRVHHATHPRAAQGNSNKTHGYQRFIPPEASTLS